MKNCFTGTINTATIHPRPIVERVLQLNAAALILAHNHPSGVSDASHQDIAVTERIRDALAISGCYVYSIIWLLAIMRCIPLLLKANGSVIESRNNNNQGYTVK